MDLFKTLEAKAKKKKKTIIFPESAEPRVQDAVKTILKKKLAKVILIDDRISKVKLPSSKDLTVLDLNFSGQFIEEYIEIKKKKRDITYAEAQSELLNPMAFACMLLRDSFADGIIAGSVYSTGEVLKNAISIIGLGEGNKTVSSFFLFTFPKKHPHYGKPIVFADCGVVPDPTDEQLAEIAVETSKNYKRLTGKKSRTAFLSFSTSGSAVHPSLDKVINAVKITKRKAPSLICDGEMQFDSAFVPDVARRKNPGSPIKGNANVFIFPDLNSGNIAYKITERIGGASATGPILQGLAKPVMDLSRGCSAEDIVKMAIVISNL